MKSSFFILPVLIAGLGVSTAATVFTTSNNATGAGGYRGLLVTLGHSGYTQASDPKNHSISQESSIQLDSFTLTSGNNTGYYGGNVYMLVFEAKADFETSVSGPLVGASNLVSWSNNAVRDHTFDFSAGVLLAPNTKYSFVFSSSNTQFVELNGGGNNQKSLRFSAGAGIDGSEGLYNSGKGYANNVAKMTIKTSSVETVPEPATATLSMLGLASLMLCRRRK